MSRPHGVRLTMIIESYADGVGRLPGALHVYMNSTFDCTHRIAVPSQPIIYYRGVPDVNARAAFIKVAHQWLYGDYSDHLIPTNICFDVAFYRTLGEVKYGQNLARLANIFNSIRMFLCTKTYCVARVH